MDEVRTGGLIGQSVKQTEDIRFITGRGRYTDDIARPDTVYAAMVRANVAHARIRSIDTAACAGRGGSGFRLHRRGYGCRQDRRIALWMGGQEPRRQPRRPSLRIRPCKQIVFALCR